MVDGRKLDNILKQGSLVTSSSGFTNLLTASLPTTDKMVYIEAWVKAQNGSSSNFFKRITTAAYGASTLALMDGYVLSPIEELIDPDDSGYDARISVNGTIVQLQVHSANNQSTTFYGHLSIHVIEYTNVSPVTIFGSDLELWLRSDMGISLDASDNVTQWEDQSGKGHHFSQSTNTDRPAYSFSDANWGSKPTLTFDGANTYLISKDDVSTWTFAHDGTGSFVLVVYKINSTANWQILINTGDTPNGGFRLLARRDSDASNYAIYNAGSAVVFENQGVANPNEYQWMALRYQYNITGNDASFWRNGYEVQSEESAIAPTSGDADSTMVIGSYITGATNFLNGEILEIIACSIRPTDAQMTQIIDYLDTRYGTTPKQILGEDLVAWYRSDLGITTVSGAVSEWADQSGNGHTLTQSSAGARPTYNTTDANWNNLPSLTFDGSADYLVSAELDTWKFLHDGSGGGALVVFRCEETGTNTGNLISTGAGTADAAGIRLEQSATDGNESRYTISNGITYLFNVVTGGPVENTNGWVLACYEEGRGGNEYLFRRDGFSNQVGNSATFPTSNSPSGQLRVGVRIGGTVFYQGDIVEIILFKVYPSAAQLEQLSGYIGLRYNL